MPKTAASRRQVGYRCGECGTEVAKWVGRCPECQAWGSITEVGAPRLRTVSGGPVTAPATPLDAMAAESLVVRPTGLGEFDRVLGGGLVPGAVILLAGEPGVGKSTLLLTVAAALAGDGQRALVVTGEESAAQVRLRARRVGALSPHVFLAAETDLAAVITHVDEVRPGLLVVDSVQTLGSPEVDGSPGGVAQVREVAAALIRIAKDRNIPTILVGHVTKDGSIAGPRLLEHLVDVVLHVEGDRHATLRLVRAVKNRYGATDEVGCFELDDSGIVELPDPSGLFLSSHRRSVAGTAVTVTVEGRRPLVSEVQALVTPTKAPMPRRAVSGLDGSRLAMLHAVLARRCAVPLLDCETYAATVGGVRVTDPGADLAVALAITSAVTDIPVPLGIVAVGEVGLAGDVRPVPALARRLTEAARLGFGCALVPAGSSVAAPPGLRVVEIESLARALAVVTPSTDPGR